MLQAALLSRLMSTRYERITVASLAREAGIGRSTFYGHYHAKDELLADAFASLADAIVAPGQRPLLGVGEGLFEHIERNRELAAALFGDASQPELLARFRSTLTDAVGADLAAAGRDDPGSTASMTVGALLGGISWWLAQPDPAPAAEVERAFLAFTEQAGRDA